MTKKKKVKTEIEKWRAAADKANSLTPEQVEDAYKVLDLNRTPAISLMSEAERDLEVSRLLNMSKHLKQP